MDKDAFAKNGRTHAEGKTEVVTAAARPGAIPHSDAAAAGRMASPRVTCSRLPAVTFARGICL
jgi:hypothetical protein